MLELKKLPLLSLQTPEGKAAKLEPDSNGHTLVVFWKADLEEGIRAYQQFQQKTELRFPGNFQDSIITRKKLIWVHLGGEVNQWKRVIGDVPVVHPTVHYRIEKTEDIMALQPYLFQGKLPVAFTLNPDSSIESVSDRPSALEFPMWEVESRGNQFIRRRQRE